MHAWRGRFTLEEGAAPAEMQMQWKEEREATLSGGHVEAYARALVAGACRGDAYVKRPSWYDVFLVFRVFAPDVLAWTFRLLLSTAGQQSTAAARRAAVPAGPAAARVPGGSEDGRRPDAEAGMRRPHVCELMPVWE